MDTQQDNPSTISFIDNKFNDTTGNNLTSQNSHLSENYQKVRKNIKALLGKIDGLTQKTGDVH